MIRTRSSLRLLFACFLASLLLLGLSSLCLPGPAVATDAAPAATGTVMNLTERVSVGSGGTQADRDTTGEPVLSAGGRFVAFDSLATNLVPNDTNETHDVFVRDRLTGETERVSVASTGSQGGDASWGPSISADGRWVAFASAAVLGHPGWSTWDIFVHDRETGETRRVSVSSDGTPADQSSMDQPAISADGHFVAFNSEATNLVPGDTNYASDVFVHDLDTGETTRVSVASDGTEGNNYSVSPAISTDGRFVAFSSGASNLVEGDDNGVFDIFLHDRQTGETTLVSSRLDGVGDGQDAHIPAISADGRWIAFTSRSSDLVVGDTADADIFIVDTTTGVLSLVSVNSDGEKGNGDSDRLAMSADGRLVAFDSAATNLVPGDTNGVSDVFVRDLQTGQTWRASLGGANEEGDAGSFAVGISPDGNFVGFASYASNQGNRILT